MIGNWWCYFTVMIPILPALFFFWYTHSISAYSQYASKVDTLFSNCTTNPPSDDSTFAVVIPFPTKQVHNVMALLYIWSLPEFSPLFPPKSQNENDDENSNSVASEEQKTAAENLRKRTKLILYPVYNDSAITKAIENFIRDNEQVSKMLSDTFSSFEILPRQIEPRFDLYRRDYMHGQWIASGNTEMFYPLMTEIAPNRNITFVLYHEPDTFPLRNGWLEKVRSYAFAEDSDFWFLGSQQRQKKAFGGRIHGHMNGNSVVRVENKCARDFLTRVYKTYRFLPYDSSIMRYLVKQRNLREAQHVMRRMRYTDLIGNFAHVEVNREDILKRFPEMYLVHGKGYFTEINKILKLENFKAGLVDVE
ncbi:hypothetical protein TRFO_38124 [Tritrichomonas foetus]|uniref:Uncharacterized protein n=1 Tax=Tritrichomonas foetus TaxID=1144522 RepID=A0A1J4JES6_9EUKA|nr:hypothetical protein TRFO_38124 [Tritrichomonas foetus]|eukprot:OHS95764.1 hypothetical protein TRFO_38124 [Tritrichomonas foetus]